MIKYLSLSLFCFLLLVVGCDKNKGIGTGTVDDGSSDKTVSSFSSSDTVDLYQKELIGLACDFAVLIPENPHIKDRSRVLEQVADSALQLGLVELARDYASRIPNWRSGNFYGKLAIYHARLNHADLSQELINLAGSKYDADQQKRNDQIRINIARAYCHLGMYDKAMAIIPTLDQKANSAIIYAARAISDSSYSFEDCVQEIDKYISLKKFGEVNCSIEAYLDLYRNFYEDAEKRELICTKIRDGYQTMPLVYVFGFERELAKVALAHNNIKEAVICLDNMDKVVYNSEDWPVESKIGFQSELAGLKFEAKLQKRAIEELQATLSLFESKGEQIIDIYRAENLCKLAEAFKVCGDNKESLRVYKQAVEQAVINVNLRPQAEDLAGICCSMALSGVEPDEVLWKQINGLYKDLGTK